MLPMKIPNAPIWFRLLYYSCFVLWISLQVTVEVYNIQCLNKVIHLSTFRNERHLDAAFLNNAITGLLTTPLAMTLMFGKLTDSKKLLLGSVGFLVILTLLNVLALVSLMLVEPALSIGGSSRQTKITISHSNVSSQHLRQEIMTWSRMFPLAQDETIEYNRSQHQHKNITAPQIITTTEGSPYFNVTTVRNSKPVINSTRASHQTGNSTFSATNRTSSTSHSTLIDAPTKRPSLLTVLTRNRTARRIWYTHIESRQLSMLSFLQRTGFCCGVHSIGDYAAMRAQPAASCRCHQLSMPRVRPTCSTRRYRLATGQVSTTWVRGCRSVIEQMLDYLGHLRLLLLFDVVFQLVVIFLTLVYTINLPSSDINMQTCAL